jgi:hypothetical protein
MCGLRPQPRFPPADGDLGDADPLRQLRLGEGDAFALRSESSVGPWHW